jgi:hypothetical protein
MHALMTGIVDCATGTLQGELRGTYRSTSFCGLGLAQDNFFFKGPISGTFDPATRSFADGKLKLFEPPVPIAGAGQPGGEGTWNTTLTDGGTTGDAGLNPDGGPADCLDGVMFKDFQVDYDASVGPASAMP